MDRRKFFKKGTLLAAGGALFGNPISGLATTMDYDISVKGKRANNIIFMVSDGMSSGTLALSDHYQNRILGHRSVWMSAYMDNKVTRGLMETSSASSIVTDSSAGSSAFGGGVRVPNGSLNVGANGEQYLPIWQKMKRKGKKIGVVTTVTATHATPAGFNVNNNSRYAEPQIAVDYLNLGVDIVMGGGDEFFNEDKREDKRDLYEDYEDKGYAVVKTLNELKQTGKNKPILGIFNEGALPYQLDRKNNPELEKKIPSLADMTKKAIEHLNTSKNGFALQIESGKVDWAAHANDLGGLLFEQIQFDEALKVALEFAEKDGETLVIFTTDHGNANPGLIYGKECDKNFETVAKYKYTNEWILNQIDNSYSPNKVRDLVNEYLGFTITSGEAHHILGYYSNIQKEEQGLYNYKHLPYEGFANMQKKHSSVGWISMDHSSDHVEVAAFGPGKELLKPFVKNTDLHYLMLQAAQIENKF
ncbi:alkaline phosphatase [Faecalibacter macacae]|uniref:Alkaline phosphatase n=1 Tax=Faecalibacter macacae TaxID=1859289 RepID=A0A3L9MEY6_9FLAO|nr:alkaline phosphatase [Faecalibacter macacae]RLZ11423.1 alkaline phosphatase [Faecalibacter macacae]